MVKKVKKLWLEALKSEKYKQGRGALKKKDRFCCLGVLCDLHRIRFKKEKWGKQGKHFEVYLGCSIELPEAVRKWAKLKERNPIIDSIHLSAYNDKGSSFNEIADIIKKEL